MRFNGRADAAGRCWQINALKALDLASSGPVNFLFIMDCSSIAAKSLENS